MPRTANGWTLRWRGGTAYVRFTFNGRDVSKSLGTKDLAVAKVAAEAIYVAHLDPRAADLSTSSSGVYFIRSDCGRMKIGFSDTVQTRVKALDQAGPRTLTLEAVAIGATMEDEKRLHAHFRPFRVRGKQEWFEPNAALRNLVRHVKATRMLPETLTSFHDRRHRPRVPAAVQQQIDQAALSR